LFFFCFFWAPKKEIELASLRIAGINMSTSNTSNTTATAGIENMTEHQWNTFVVTLPTIKDLQQRVRELEHAKANTSEVRSRSERKSARGSDDGDAH
jgi:hypothetical protein